MESKPLCIQSDVHEFLTFNRTSMESKHGCVIVIPFALLILLIEPVWNRNMIRNRLLPSSSTLLIEPVWNRNCELTSTITRHRCLLIEPVWNRNVIATFIGVSDAQGLLIEPVWNRNVCSADCASVMPVPFNRTSMESKPTINFCPCPPPWSFNRTSMESKRI